MLVSVGIAGLALLALAVRGHNSPFTIQTLMAVCGFGLSGAWIVLYPLLAQSYPSSVRAIGTGAALTWGRMGSILSALFVATVLTAGGPTAALLAIAAVAVLAPLALRRARHQLF
jgi:AAHS family 4-hydroxybenzoate transporter-like MFS transporter